MLSPSSATMPVAFDPTMCSVEWQPAETPSPMCLVTRLPL